MRALGYALAFGATFMMGSCGPNPVSSDEYGTIKITFPNGQVVRADQLVKDIALQTGMKWRDSLPEDRGMLFVFGKEREMPFWMFEVKIPLDMIWLDRNHTITEIVYSVPPCPGPREKCPSYGGTKPASYVLELAGGVARKNHLQTGMQLDF